MKIFKHTFNVVDDYEIVDGEIQVKEQEYTMHFSLNNRGQLIFEREYGTGIMSALQKNQEDVLDPNLIRALATASYKNINHLSDDELNAIEFKDSPVYSACVFDQEFIAKLFEMIQDCLGGNKPAPKKATTRGNKTKK